MSERQSLFLSPYFIGVLAIFFAACMNTSIKGLSVNESVIMVTAWRYLFGAIYAPTLAGLQTRANWLAGLSISFEAPFKQTVFLGGHTDPVGHEALGTLMIGPLVHDETGVQPLPVLQALGTSSSVDRHIAG